MLLQPKSSIKWADFFVVYVYKEGVRWCVCVWASVRIRSVGYYGVGVFCGESEGRDWMAGAVHLLCMRVDLMGCCGGSL